MFAWLRSQRPRHATVVAYLALFVALGGTSYAAISLSKNSVRSKHIAKGQVKPSDVAKNAIRSRHVKNGALLAADFKAGQLPAGAQGPPGPPGPQGAQGPPGLQGPAGQSATALWAVVNSNGTVDRSSGLGAGTGRLSTGTYEVIFNQGVSDCAYVGAVSGTGFASGFGFFSAVRRGGNANGLFVQTRDPANVAADAPFHVAVFC